MLRQQLRLAGRLVILWICGSVIASAQERTPALAVGAVAGRDYFAPVDLVVIDVPATVARAAAAGAQLPLVARTDPRAADAAVAEFEAAFDGTHRAYVDALEVAFGTRTLDSPGNESARFRSFHSEFQSDNPRFPVSLALAQSWAQGADGEPIRARLAATLRATMTSQLIGDIRPASTVYVASLETEDRIRAWSEASPHTRAVDHAAITSLDAAGHAMRQSLDVLDRGTGGFLTGLLRPNIAADDYLTALLLHDRFRDQVQMRAYQRGDSIIKAGTPIDHFGALAVAQLERMGQEPAEVAIEAVPPTSPAVLAPTEPASTAPKAATQRRQLLGIVGMSLGALVLAGLGLLWGARRQQTTSEPTQWVDHPGTAPAGNVREALLPHLARELKNRLVHALFAQRQELLHNEAAASARVADLEARLARLQPAIAEKIRGYEKRIEALEAEIEEKDQETRDLLRAKLVLARKELDAEIRRQHITWN